MPLRARDIADICDELAIERASVTVMGGWDPDHTQFSLSFGPVGNRQIIVINPKLEIDDVRALLQAAKRVDDGLSFVSAVTDRVVAHSPREIVRMDQMDPVEHWDPLGPPRVPAKPAQKRKKAKGKL